MRIVAASRAKLARPKRIVLHNGRAAMGAMIAEQFERVMLYKIALAFLPPWTPSAESV
jgi:hypothetical protein